VYPTLYAKPISLKCTNYAGRLYNQSKSPRTKTSTSTCSAKAYEGLSSGLTQFSPTSSFVPWEGGDLKDFRVDVRPNYEHWGGGRPALKKSLADLEKELMRKAAEVYLPR